MATFEINFDINRPVGEVFAFISRKTKFSILLFLVTSLLLSGCVAIQVPGPTLTPPTTTPSPTATILPTRTPTLIPISSTYIPVPRWMMLGQPGYGVEILGEKWNYTNDRWGETYACIDYTREKEPYLFFEECFAWARPDLTFETQRDAFLNDDFEVLTTNNTFGGVVQISLMAKRLEDNSTKFVKFFEIIGTEKYILLVEMNFATDDQSPLQTIYENQAAGTIDYVLENGLQKSRLIPSPTATPLSPTQASLYDDLALKLITEEESNKIYTATWVGEAEGSIDGTWEALGDSVSSKIPKICRDFEDRTNVDVLWVGFSNCVYKFKDPSYFEKIVEDYKKPGDVLLESRHPYQERFVIYGYQDGHTYFYAFMLHEGFLYFVNVESRTLSLDNNFEHVFTETTDDFIYAVLMVNAQR
jgi:hypothetical protein